jgi:spermidine synthase
LNAAFLKVSIVQIWEIIKEQTEPSMKKWDYALSYLYPVTVEITSSQWNPVLEIVLDAGKYSLNSENTNYSHGTLHTLFEKIFRRLNLEWNSINNVLILGFGTGSIASIIGKYKPDCLIEGVEIDRKVIDLGEKYFQTGLIKNLTIHCTSADRFLEDCQKKYDLIMIDVYIDMKVPEEIETERFLLNIKGILRPGGMVVFNKAIYTKAIRDQVLSLKELYEKVFKNLEVVTVMNTGKIFIAKRTD